jgi:hypothetical protein
MFKGRPGVIEKGMLPAPMNLHIIIEDQSTTQENYVDDNITSLALGTSCGLFHVRICPTGPSVSHRNDTVLRNQYPQSRGNVKLPSKLFFTCNRELLTGFTACDN